MTTEVRIFRIPLSGPGSLAIATRPRGDGSLSSDIAALRQQGIDLLVSLLCADEAGWLGLTGEPAACEAAGLEFLAVPVRDFETPDSPLEFIKTVRGLVGLLRQGRSIAVHCRGGIGRSGMLAVSILVGTGVQLHSAIETVSRARGVDVPEAPGQKDWLRQHEQQLAEVAPL
jgi:protein-tyrosine phosphatase